MAKLMVTKKMFKSKFYPASMNCLFAFILLIGLFAAPPPVSAGQTPPSGIKAFFGYRFNLTYQMIHMSRTLGDITILMIVGSVPDYVQGSVKLFWALTGKLRT